MPGLTSCAEPGRAVWLQEDATGRRVPIGRFDPALPGPENRMRPLPEGFLSLGVPALARCAAAPGGWAAVDEVGYLETACPAYCAALLALMDARRLLAAVRRQELPLLQGLCRRPDVFLVDLDAPFGALGCVVMASGLGRRFGSNKLLADFGGEPLFTRALEATGGIFARRVVVTRHPEIAAHCARRGIRAVLHGEPERRDTIRLGLTGMDGLAGCLFCPADQPLLSRQTVAALALAAVNAPDRPWRAAWQGQGGAPVLFPARDFAALRSLGPGQGGSAVLRAGPAAPGQVEAGGPDELRDADRPEELDRLRQKLSKNREI